MTDTNTEHACEECTACSGTGSGKDGWDCLSCSGDGWVFAKQSAAHTSTEKSEALIFANDRPSEISYDLYQWAMDAEDMIRSLHERVQELEKMNLTHLDVISNLATEGMKREEKLIELEASQARVLLSDEQAFEAVCTAWILPKGVAVDVARAIEAAHGIIQGRE